MSVENTNSTIQLLEALIHLSAIAWKGITQPAVLAENAITGVKPALPQHPMLAPLALQAGNLQPEFVPEMQF
jgi:hypothetical protein